MSKHLMLCVVALFSLAAAPEKKPNVLFIISDDLGPYLASYGAPVQTPNLDKLASRGVRFERAYCQFPLCGPSRASLMSGMRPDTIGVLTNGPTVRDKRPGVVTLPQLFKNNGYLSARIGKIYHLGIPGDVGKPGPDDPQSWTSTFNPPGAEFTTDGEEHWPDKKDGQGFRYVMGKGDGKEQHDYQAADEAIRLLNQHKAERFFLALGFIRPHVPVIAPRTYFDLYPLEQIKLPNVPANDRDDIPALAFPNAKIDRDMTPQQCLESIRAYRACTSFMDAQLGRVLDELDRLRLSDRTIIVFIGDHGYNLGQHRSWQKMMLFEQVCRVPMIIAAPGVKPAETKALAEMIDLYPTVAALAALTVPAEVEGVSLVPVLKDPATSVKQAAYTQVRRGNRGEGRTVRSDRFRYTEWNSGDQIETELYDEQSDPEELTNLATDPKHADPVAEMKKLLAKTATKKEAAAD